MDGSDVRFLLPGAPGASKFVITQGVISMEDHSLEFRGVGGVRYLSLGPGWTFDLTGGVGGAEQLYLDGPSRDYRVRLKGDVLMLSAPAQGTVVRLQAGRGPYNIVFEDGFIRIGDLWRSVTQASALCRLAGESASTDGALVPSHVHPSRDMAFQREAHVLPEGAALRVTGLDRVETVYGAGTASAIWLEGAFADYGITTRGPVVSLDWQRRGRFECIYLVGERSLSFSDGEVSASELRQALQGRVTAPVDGATLDMEQPKATSVSVSIDPLTAACSDSWFVGLSHGGLLSGLCVGQMLEATVSFNEAIVVNGAPRLGLRIGGLERIARYSGSSGSDTVRFSYVVMEDDVLEASRRVIDAGASRADRLRLEVEVGDLLLNDAEILPMSSAVFHNTAECDRGDGCGPCIAWTEQHGHVQKPAGVRPRLDIDLNVLEQVGDL